MNEGRNSLSEFDVSYFIQLKIILMPKWYKVGQDILLQSLSIAKTEVPNSLDCLSKQQTHFFHPALYFKENQNIIVLETFYSVFHIYLHLCLLQDTHETISTGVNCKINTWISPLVVTGNVTYFSWQLDSGNYIEILKLFNTL